MGSDFVTKTIDDARKIVMKISDDENVSTTNEMNIQESKKFESRDLVTEDKHQVSAKTNQATSESSSSFQEVQIIKSRTCIEEDRFSRNDTENQTNIKVSNEIFKEETKAVKSDNTDSNEDNEKQPIEGNKNGTDEKQLKDEEKLEASDNQNEIIEPSDANISKDFILENEVKEKGCFSL